MIAFMQFLKILKGITKTYHTGMMMQYLLLRPHKLEQKK